MPGKSKQIQNPTYRQLASILKKIPLSEKIKLKALLEKEIEKENNFPKGFIPAEKEGNYTAICGLWNDVNFDIENFKSPR
ncbi:MAG TPA: hypothetical protein DCQ31_09900 [Bacteroidales bacterium]|nr:hypothetical protein [Bacteroidales bacterium]